MAGLFGLTQINAAAVKASPFDRVVTNAGLDLTRATSLPRLHASNLVYQGAFTLPNQMSDTKTFSYGGTAMAFDPSRHGLFIVGHDWYQMTAEVSIPALVKSASTAKLHQAKYLQGFVDATNGAIDQAGNSTNKIGGQLVYSGRLYGTAYVYYDASDSQVVSHWVRPSTSLTAGKAKGLFRVGDLGAGMVSGFMALVPPGWTSLLGGPVLTGNCCIPIISRTSFGPAAFAINPANFKKGKVTPDHPLVYYPANHTTLGAWNASWRPKKGVVFGGGTAIRGMVFPPGSRTLLYFGTQGVGKFCYGEGTNDKSLNGKPTPDGTIWCYDPDNSSKGTHAYPYVPEVWAYDAAAFVNVRKGLEQPWQVRPYATWTLKLPFGSNISGAAYDPANNLIYISQQYGPNSDPLVEVLKVEP
jgi:hypothetical protein